MTPLGPVPSLATPAGDNVVINEVYVRGASADGVYRDYVELYNPTDSPIALSGLSLQYVTGKGGNGTPITSLDGNIPAKGYYLVAGASKDQDGQHANLAKHNPDSTDGHFNMSASSGTIILVNGTDRANLSGDVAANETVVDAFGWGTVKVYEGAYLSDKTSGDKSYQRTNGTDTDNNANDFTIAVATPKGASSGTTDPSEPTDPETPETNTVTIEEIQGTGAASPLVDKTVTTTGWVTAVYPTGGFSGAYIQANGTDPAASDAVFVYSSKLANAVKKGDFIEVTGKVSEYKELTELSATDFKVIDAPADSAKPEPLKLEKAPETEEAREAIEGMLVQVTGTHTVADNYGTNRYGTIGLTAGDKPLRQPSDAYNPTKNPEEIAALADANEAAKIGLDDGQSWDYTRFDQKNDQIPVAYLNVNNPLRVGAQVEIKQPVIFEYRFGWVFQPTEPVNVKGGEDNSYKWVALSGNDRPVAPGDFSEAGANLTVTSFNVLNYFTDLGEDEANCKYYADREGNPVTANYCNVRGAYSKAAFERQQTKIVAAINELDSSIVGLEEIENSARFGQDRDASLAALVTALNTQAQSDKWAYVPSPEATPKNEDVIRLAYIYQPAEVTAVGDSSILIENEYFDDVARQPLAQKWQAVDENGEGVGEEFVTVVNHFKSKGSLSKVFPDDSDEYQGNNNKLRTAQAKKLSAWVSKEFAGEPVVLLGDLNSYSKEDPILALEEAGYTSAAEMFNVETPSYLFSGLVGSLDHGLVNAAAKDMLVGADVWEVNAMEPIAFEYSRYNYNVKFEELFDNSPFRSSDHNPLKMGLKTVEDQTTDPSEPGDLTVVTPAAPSFINPSASDPASCTVKPYATVEDADGVIYTVTVDGKELTANEDGKFVYPYGKTIKVTAAPDEGFKFSEGAQTEWSWTAELNDKCDPQPTTTPTTAPGQPTTAPAQPGKPGGLAQTGVSVTGLLLAMAGLGLAGAAGVKLSRRERI